GGDSAPAAPATRGGPAARPTADGRQRQSPHTRNGPPPCPVGRGPPRHSPPPAGWPGPNHLPPSVRPRRRLGPSGVVQRAGSRARPPRSGTRAVPPGARGSPPGRRRSEATPDEPPAARPRPSGTDPGPSTRTRDPRPSELLHVVRGGARWRRVARVAIPWAITYRPG